MASRTKIVAAYLEKNSAQAPVAKQRFEAAKQRANAAMKALKEVQAELASADKEIKEAGAEYQAALKADLKETKAPAGKNLAGIDREAQRWLKDVQKRIIDPEYKDFPLGIPQLLLMKGPKYFRVVKQDKASKSAYAFIDRRTGDILKPAGWKGPARGVRGNLFDQHKGLKAVTPYGAVYH